MSKEPIQTYHFYPERYFPDSWEDVSRLIEHLEALNRTYTIRKYRHEQKCHTSEHYTHRVWWWPFKKTGTRMVSEMRKELRWTVEEYK